MKTPLGTEEDLGPRRTVLDGDPALPTKGAQQAPLFSVHVYCVHGRPPQLLLRPGLYMYLLPASLILIMKFDLITFCVSRRRRKMYCGHTRLCVCLSVRGRMPTVFYGPGCNLGEW